MAKFSLAQVQDAVECNYGTDAIDTHEQTLICLFDDNVAPEIRIKIVEKDSSRSAQGIHVLNLDTEADLWFEIGRALDECFRSGFQTIWIHQ